MKNEHQSQQTRRTNTAERASDTEPRGSLCPLYTANDTSKQIPATSVTCKLVPTFLLLVVQGSKSASSQKTPMFRDYLINVVMLIELLAT